MFAMNSASPISGKTQAPEDAGEFGRFSGSKNGFWRHLFRYVDALLPWWEHSTALAHMKSISLVFALMVTPIAQATTEGAIPPYISAAFSELQMKVIVLGAWMLGGALVGAIMARTWGGKSKARREVIFSLACLVGGALGMFTLLG